MQKNFLYLCGLIFLLGSLLSCSDKRQTDEADEAVHYVENYGKTAETENFGEAAKKPDKDLIEGAAIHLNTYAHQKDEEAFMEKIYTVSSYVLALYLEEGWIAGAQLIPYEKEDGDTIIERGTWNHLIDYILVRNGVEIGYYVKDTKGNEFINLYEKKHGKKLPFDKLQDQTCYTLFSKEDENYFTYQNPSAVYLKSKPVDYIATTPPNGGVLGHTVYLVFDEPLKEGCTYQLDFEKIGVMPQKGEFLYDSKTCVSEAIHVGQVGFNADDPQKKAFLSLWMGSGKSMEYNNDLYFNLLDENGDVHYEGKVKLTFPMLLNESLNQDKNYNQTDVYTMDFSGFTKTGVYRVHIPGIGTSLPFEIGQNVWEEPFLTVMYGFYTQRSGIALTEPYSSYTRPRPFHPDDGVIVYHSECSLFESGNGLNAYDTDTDNFGNLVRGKTDEIVPDAWGGYFDAGDWDRRIQHLEATRLQLEMLLLNPDYFGKIKLSIPESGNHIPDLLNEALWNIDCYRRMQTPAGGIRGGIETTEHPKAGETSWTNSLPVMAYAPDHWSSYIYAGVAARAAYVMEQYGIDPYEIYKSSAVRAFKWAEAEYVDWLKPERQEGAAERAKNESITQRTLAAIELYRLTGESLYHDIFKQNIPIKYENQLLEIWEEYSIRDGFAVYLSLPEEMRDDEIYKLAFNSLLNEANGIVEISKKNAFGIAVSNRYSGMAWGFYGAPNIHSLVRAHYLTQDEKYLKCLLGELNFTTGANPINTCFTTGIGNYVETALVVDTRFTGQKPPAGLTVFGPWDINRNLNYWIYTAYGHAIIYPDFKSWPNIDGFVPIYAFAPHTEFTINGSMGHMAYYTGYLSMLSGQ